MSALIAITQTNLVSSTIPSALIDPTSLLGSRRLIFGDMVGWGTKEAISKSCWGDAFFLFLTVFFLDIYNDRRHNLIEERILNPSKDLQDAADE